jgi:protein TonB
VKPDGTTANCTIDSVTGGSAFGTEALAYARRSRYSPRTHNGVPEESRHQWNIKFKLGD